ncbi:glycosyltransferase family 2 protein [Candidatus Saccharibacteria bacterium]|nr:glycosyltransferase family 2 protein [Candidatus Saccharibacteria bacterium]
MSKPRISVIIPVYNTAKSAVKLVRDLLTFPDNLEIIVIDDGSDKSQAEYLDRELTPPVQLSHQKNQGPSAARNKGLKHATGEYIAFIDSDDSVSRNFFSAMLATINKETPPADLAVCGFRYHRLKGNTVHDEFATPPIPRLASDTDKTYVLRLFLQDGRLHAIINKLFRTSIIRQHHLTFDKNLKYGEDTVFVLQYLAASNGKIAFCPGALYHYEYGSGLSSQSSADWRNWQPLYDTLVSWASNGKSIEPTEYALLNAIYHRWKTACRHAKLRQIKEKIWHR